MSIDFSKITGLSDSKGVITQITDASGRVLWRLKTNKPVVLEVEKITSDTYVSSTSYTGEQFILLDIYPKTAGSTVNVTYGGLTKILTFSSTSKQQVYFGTYGGVSDEVETPTSGELTIEGGCVAFGIGSYNSAKSSTKYCTCITGIIEWGDTTQIVSSAFRTCDRLTSVTIPSKVSSIGNYAFQGCTSLIDATFHDVLKEIGLDAFKECTGLTNVTIPGSVTYINGFPYCTGLKSVNILEGTRFLQNGSFLNCSSLVSVVIPSSVTSIHFYAFAGCTSLTNIMVDSQNEHFSSEGGILLNKNKTEIYSFPSVVGHYTVPSSVTTIGEYAFYRTRLTSITVPSSVTTIGEYAFYNCTALTNVEMLAETPPTVGTSIFYNITTPTITVPSGCSDRYKVADGWSEYADFIVEVS